MTTRTVKFPSGSTIHCNSMAQVAWEIVNDYVKSHKGITLANLRAIFATIPSNPNPLICEWYDATHHYKKDGITLDQPRYCINDPDDKIALANDLIVTVSNQWKDTEEGNFRVLCTVASKLGYVIK